MSEFNTGSQDITEAKYQLVYGEKNVRRETKGSLSFQFIFDIFL